ncbi:MAG: Gfo/Idh/MocA family oxidoreductase [Clostridiales bacterium]|jgi:predicted dehydrogenase|nr:Gfo/Idh/MocA family oxidoreductase [Clostridiales bacterium]OPZ70024.1 MAG: putative oxidoreductase YvaA [Firmicutes bacterium ADurb.Bin467]
MGRKLHYGMVGGGPGAFIGDAHRRSINLDGMAELVAGCFSRSYEGTLETGKALGIAPDRLYRTFEEMAAAESKREDGIDFAVVVTPNHAHYAACKAFLEAGIHVSCDKPLCVNSEQALELERLAREKGLLFLVTYTYMGHVTAKHAREIIKRGDIGTVRTVAAEYPQGWLAHEGEWGGKQGSWRCDPKQSGDTNCLGDIGTHIENTVAMMTGLKIRRVLAKMDKVVPGRLLDDNDFVLVEYENGATGMYWSSQIAIGHDNSLRVRIYGDGGSIQWFQEEPEKITVVKKDGSLTEHHRGYGSIAPAAAKYARLPSGHPEGWIEAMANLYRSFIECIRAKEAGTFAEDMVDFPTVSDGADGVRFIEACLKSTRNGNTWVEL